MLAAASAGARPLDIYNSMRDTPITRFEKSDIDLMKKTLSRALESGEDGVAVSWQNPATPASGTVTPAKDPQGRPGCRMAHVENRHRSLRNAGDFIFCKNKGEWRLVGPAAGN
jgi:hypothetical protein